MGDDSILEAAEHVSFIKYILGVYGKDLGNFCCIIGDNCTTNKVIANKLSIPLIGCGSHRFCLALQKLLEGEDVLHT